MYRAVSIIGADNQPVLASDKFRSPYKEAWSRVTDREVPRVRTLPETVIDVQGSLALLECGHKVIVGRSNRKRVRCLRCTEMLRRSAMDGSFDYDAFRAGTIKDTMVWTEDPLRFLHEKGI